MMRDRVLKAVRPRPSSDLEECWRDFCRAVEYLKMISQPLPPGEVKRRYEAAAESFHEAGEAAKALVSIPPPDIADYPYLFPPWRGADEGSGELEHLIELLAKYESINSEMAKEVLRAHPHSDIPTRLKRSGGPSDPHRKLKQTIANFAYSFLKIWSDREPSLTAGGAYFTVASLMFEETTGQKGVQLIRHCSEWLRRMGSRA